MRLIRAIVISSLTIPALIFILFFIAGFVYMVANLVQGGEYHNGWLGLVYAGATYAYMAVLISSIPTITLGLFAIVLANKYNLLCKQVILPGAFLLGGIFLSIAGAFIFKSYSMQTFMWLLVVGGAGGLINGAVLSRCVIPGSDTDSAALNLRRLS